MIAPAQPERAERLGLWLRVALGVAIGAPIRIGALFRPLSPRAALPVGGAIAAAVVGVWVGRQVPRMGVGWCRLPGAMAIVRRRKSAAQRLIRRTRFEFWALLRYVRWTGAGSAARSRNARRSGSGRRGRPGLRRPSRRACANGSARHGAAFERRFGLAVAVRRRSRRSVVPQPGVPRPVAQVATHRADGLVHRAHDWHARLTHS